MPLPVNPPTPTPPLAPPRVPSPTPRLAPPRVPSPKPVPAPQRPSNNGAPSGNNMTLQLTIGNVQFKSWEVPETLPKLFGVKKMAVHDFPGGKRTIQQLGIFPFPEIDWHGTLWDGDYQAGTSAMTRATQLNQLRTTQQPAVLTWNQFTYAVLVKEFEIIGRMKQMLDYHIVLVPISDNTTTSNPQDPQTAEEILSDALQQLTQTTDMPASGATLPTNISTISNSILSQIQSALASANQTLALIPQTTITNLQNQIINLQSLLPVYINGIDFALASASVDLNGALTAVYDALGQVLQSIIQQVTVVNPNLYQLASMYYGDQGLWALIASANNLQDAFLTGSYTLVIPAPNASSPFAVS